MTTIIKKLPPEVVDKQLSDLEKTIYLMLIEKNEKKVETKEERVS